MAPLARLFLWGRKFRRRLSCSPSLPELLPLAVFKVGAPRWLCFSFGFPVKPALRLKRHGLEGEPRQLPHVMEGWAEWIWSCVRRTPQAPETVASILWRDKTHFYQLGLVVHPTMCSFMPGRNAFSPTEQRSAFKSGGRALVCPYRTSPEQAGSRTYMWGL